MLGDKAYTEKIICPIPHRLHHGVEARRILQEHPIGICAVNQLDGIRQSG
jgi:hypothetical protein